MDKNAVTANDFRRVFTERRALPEHVREGYRSEMRPIVRELHALLPRYRRCVTPTRYAFDREELMVLTACYCDDALDIYALETLLENLKRHRQVFFAALETPGAA